MKTLNKLSILALTSILVLSSCETTELDLTTNPNALNPSQASADLFINGIQEDFAYFVDAFSLLSPLNLIPQARPGQASRSHHRPGTPPHGDASHHQ